MTGNSSVNDNAINNIASFLGAFWDGSAMGMTYAGWGQHIGSVGSVGLAFSAGFGAYSTINALKQNGLGAGVTEMGTQVSGVIIGKYGAMIGAAVGAEFFGISGRSPGR